EGQSAAFTVTLSEAAASDITVNLAGLPTGTATFGTDYTVVGLTAPSVTIPAGQTSVSVTVNASTDTETEGAETVIVSLAAGTGYVLGTPSSATLTIVDQGTAVDPTVTLSVAPATINEGENAQFIVTLSEAATSDITVNLAGLPTGTATFGTDYTVVGLAAPSVTIPAGQTSVSVTVNASTDTETEGAETVIVSLAAGTGYVLGTPSSATL